MLGNISCFRCRLLSFMRRSRERRQQVRKNHKSIWFHSNTGPDSLIFSKISSQHSMLCHHRHASATPFKWRFVGGQCWPNFSGIRILSALKNKQTFWIRTRFFLQIDNFGFGSDPGQDLRYIGPDLGPSYQQTTN